MKYKISKIRWVVGIVTLLFLADPIQALTLKIATITPGGSSWMRTMRAGSDEIAKKTDNRVKFKWYPGGVMGDTLAVFRKIRLGQLHGATISSGKLNKYYQDSQIYSLPLQFKSFDEIDYVRKQMDPLIIEGLEKGGLINFGLSEGGFAYVLSKNSITSLPDLQSQKVWIPDDNKFGLLALEAFEVTPIPLKLSDVLVGLQTQLVNTVATSPIAALALQWHTQVEYLTDTPVIYFFAVLGIDQKVFKKISKEDQKIVRSVMERVFKELDQKNRKDNLAAFQALQQQGIQLIQLSDEQKAIWQQKAVAATQSIIANGEISQPMYDTLEKHLKEFRSQ